MESGFKVISGVNTCQSGIVTAAGSFPDVKVAGVGFLVTREDKRFDPMRMAGFLFRLDELVIALPVRIRLRVGKGGKDHRAALPLSKEPYESDRIARKEEVGQKNPERIGPERNGR